MRDIKLTIPAGETSHQEVALRAWLVRYVETDDAIKLVTHDQGSLLIHAGQQVELDEAVQGFELINTTASPVVLHLQVAGKASIGSKKNDSGSGGPHVDQTARDAAAAALVEADEIELLALDNAEDLAELRATGPFAQVLQDSGRLADFETYTTGLGTGNNFNSASCPTTSTRTSEVESFKFTHNNSTNGGSKAANDALVESLLDAMGRSGNKRRYGTEFFVAKRQFLATPNASSKVTFGGADYFLGNAGTVLVGFDGWASTAQWVFCTIDDDMLASISGSGVLYVDGVEVPANKMQLSAGWHHVAYTLYSDAGYVAAHPRIYGKASADFAQALPVVSRNNVQIPVHSAPIPYN